MLEEERIQELARQFGMSAPTDSESGRDIIKFLIGREYTLQLLDFVNVPGKFYDPSGREIPNIKYTFLDLEDNKEKVVISNSKPLFAALFYGAGVRKGEKVAVLRTGSGKNTRYEVKKLS